MSEHISTGPSRALPRRSLRHELNTQDATVPMVHAPGCTYGTPRPLLSTPPPRGLSARYAQLVEDTRADLVALRAALHRGAGRVRSVLHDRVALCTLAGAVGLVTGGLVIPRWPVESARAELAPAVDVGAARPPRAMEPAYAAMCEAPPGAAPSPSAPPVAHNAVAPSPAPAGGCRGSAPNASPLPARRELARPVRATAPRALPKVIARVAPARARPAARPARPIARKAAPQVTRASTEGEAARRAALADEALRAEKAERAAAFFARNTRPRAVAAR